MVVNNEFSKREVQERLATALNQARVALWHQLDTTPGMSPYEAGQELENFYRFTLYFQDFKQASVTQNYHNGSPTSTVKFTWVPVPLQPGW
jgi:hypothetical protein